MEASNRTRAYVPAQPRPGLGRGKRKLRPNERSAWTPNHELRLLENGEEFYPRLFEQIDDAREHVVIETFIWFEDKIGSRLAEVLIRAAERGVRVDVLVDGYGTPGFSQEFLDRLRGAGVRVRQFDPQPTLLGIRTNLLCRMHRKIAVIDNDVAFVGGINVSDDHLGDHGEESKQDYAVEVRGPVVSRIRDFVLPGKDAERGRWRRRWRYWIRRFPREFRDPGDDRKGIVLFAVRDNDQHPTDIETLYRMAIRHAKKEIIIANAYFFPGYRFIRDLRRACRRGVTVKLIMQGNPDMPLEVGAASIIYDDLVASGVKIYRYMRRALHAKVAVVDQHWSTVGSSNLDPTSLGLNYEANIVALDRSFNNDLRLSLERLIAESCEEYRVGAAPASWLRRAFAALAYHLTRRMATWGSWVLRWRRRQHVTSL